MAILEREVEKQQYTHVGLQTSLLPTRRFTLDEYHWLIEQGFFKPDDRLELLGGYLVPMSPVNPPHASSIGRLTDEFYRHVGGKVAIRIQQPITLQDQESEPEPDLLIAKRDPEHYVDRHPSAEETLLLIEVSDSSLAQDRQIKSAYYAAAQISEYWILNLVDGQIETYQTPITLAGGAVGYQDEKTYQFGEVVAPQALPECKISVDEIIPLVK